MAWRRESVQWGSNARRRTTAHAMQPRTSSAANTATAIAPVDRLDVWRGCGEHRGAMLFRVAGVRQQVLDGGERVAEHLPGRLGGVDRADAPGLGARKLLVGGGDRSKKLLALALQPVGLQRALVLALAAGGRRDAQQQRAVGRERAGGEQR